MTETFRYRLPDGRQLVSVTQVLKISGRIDPRLMQADAAARGTAVHTLTERFDRKDDVATRGELAGYVDAYAKFIGEVKPEFGDPDWIQRQFKLNWLSEAPGYGLIDDQAGAVERRVRSAKYRAAGRIDRICRQIFGHPGIVDIKTGQPQKWHGEQLAGYNRLCPTGQRVGVYLQATGNYRVKVYTDASDDRKFMADLARVLAIVDEEQETTTWLTQRLQQRR